MGGPVETLIIARTPCATGPRGEKKKKAKKLLGLGGQWLKWGQKPTGPGDKPSHKSNGKSKGSWGGGGLTMGVQRKGALGTEGWSLWKGRGITSKAQSQKKKNEE